MHQLRQGETTENELPLHGNTKQWSGYLENRHLTYVSLGVNPKSSKRQRKCFFSNKYNTPFQVGTKG